MIIENEHQEINCRRFSGKYITLAYEMKNMMVNGNQLKYTCIINEFN